MPRKKNGIPFVLQPRPTKGADGKPLLYAHLEPGRKLTLDWLDEEFRGQGRYQPGDVRRMMEIFAVVTSRYIADGYRIETPLGTFAPKLKMTGEFTDPAMVGNGNVDMTGIEYTPSAFFKRKVKQYDRGCHKVDTYVGNAQMQDEQAMQEALQQSMGRHGFVTIKAFCVYSHLKYKSARRYLDSLCEGEHPLFSREKSGGVIFYVPVQSDRE
ncbi:MAG: hypothetical protein IJV38_02290 [Prevotella sp.]|nr:hypothetical protein [Prevotella sp.]